MDPVVRRYGYAVHYGGQFEAQQSAARTIYLMGAGVIVVILLLVTANDIARMALEGERSVRGRGTSDEPRSDPPS